MSAGVLGLRPLSRSSFQLSSCWRRENKTPDPHKSQLHFSMAGLSSPLLPLLVILLAASAQIAHGVQFTVGGDAGWTLPSFGHVNYTDWSFGNRYHPGDTLLFKYNKEYHNLMVVSKLDFITCSNVDPIATFQDGHTVISLNITGPHFYICGVPGHCAQGQKLMVIVRKRGNGRRHGPSPSPLPAVQSFPSVHNPGNGPASGPLSAAVPSSVSWTSLAVLVTGFLIQL